jgi:hypothetical protein
MKQNLNEFYKNESNKIVNKENNQLENNREKKFFCYLKRIFYRFQ